MNWKNETNAEYHSIPGINYSYLKDIYDWQMFIPIQKTNLQNNSMKKGTALHYAVLQPELFDDNVECYHDNLPFSPENSEPIKLPEADYNDVLKMRDSIFSNPLAMELLENVYAEQSGYVDIDYDFLNDNLRLQCPPYYKIKCDARKLNVRRDTPDVIIDLKSTSAKNIDDIQNSIELFHYDLQAYHYLRTANLIEIKNGSVHNYKAFWWIFVQNTAPFRCFCLKLSDEDYRIGKHKWQTAINILKLYYEKGIIRVTLPCPEWKISKYFSEFKESED